MGARTASGDFLQEEPSQIEKVNTKSSQMPRGIPYILGNEAAERFSYYGMRTILVVFMTQFLMGRTGQLAPMSQTEATSWYHVFMSANYFFPIFGAIVADVFLGKYKSILWLSSLYCLGHLALALDETRLGLSLGLTLIALGSGGIKPAVSAHVGDQFNASNQDKIGKAFNAFYFSINFGSFFSTLLTPWLLQHYGPSVAFGVPGGLMLLATIVFKLGDKVFIAVPPVGWKKYKEDLLSPQGKKAIWNLSVMYVFIAVFWALYDQNGSSWVFQAERMNRMIDIFGYKFELMAAQLQALNPILILAFIPLFDAVVYPAISKIYPLNAVRKMTIGMFIAAASFVIVAVSQSWLDAGHDVSMAWQALAFIVLTTAEIMVYGTGLEFSYTQAPKSMKSFIMGLFLLSISLGNFFTAMIDHLVEEINLFVPWANLLTVSAEGANQFSANYFWLFTILMAGTAVVFGLFSSRYKEEKYIQSHDISAVPTEH